MLLALCLWSACCPRLGLGWGLQMACPASFLPAGLLMSDPSAWICGLGVRAVKPSFLIPRGVATPSFIQQMYRPLCRWHWGMTCSPIPGSGDGWVEVTLLF